MRGFNITKGLALSSLTWSFNLRYSVHNPGVVQIVTACHRTRFCTVQLGISDHSIRLSSARTCPSNSTRKRRGVMGPSFLLGVEGLLARGVVRRQQRVVQDEAGDVVPELETGHVIEPRVHSRIDPAQAGLVDGAAEARERAGDAWQRR